MKPNNFVRTKTIFKSRLYIFFSKFKSGVVEPKANATWIKTNHVMQKTTLGKRGRKGSRSETYGPTVSYRWPAQLGAQVPNQCFSLTFWYNPTVVDEGHVMIKWTRPHIVMVITGEEPSVPHANTFRDGWWQRRQYVTWRLAVFLGLQWTLDKTNEFLHFPSTILFICLVN